MRIILLLILTIILVSCNSKIKEASKEIHVLFIGNSLTNYNDTPQILQKMLDEKNSNVKIDQITNSGFSLGRHLNKMMVSKSENGVNILVKNKKEITETEKKLKEKKWDIIVLQTGGVAVLIPESVEYQVDPAIKKIKHIVNNQNTRFILFNTWTTKIDYPKKYCYSGRILNEKLDPNKEFCSAAIKNSKQYLELLKESYKNIAEENTLEITNHSDIFQNAFDNHPELKILEDNMHPSKNGAFLSACIFYKLITGRNPEKLDYTAELDPETAKLLQKAAS
jgi:hypothetical protein